MIVQLLIIAFSVTCMAHSTMSCVSKVGGACAIKTRQDPFYMDVAPRCCAGGTAKATGAATDAVKCPAPQAAGGDIMAGSTFTVEWPARNHATPGQDPDGGITDGVSIYVAPATATTLGDYCGSTTVDRNCPNKIGSASYGPTTCQGGTNGDNHPCSVTVTMPANKPAGKYNLLWLWDWRHNDGSMYSACGDFNVVASTGTVPTMPPTLPPSTLPPTMPPTTLPPTANGQTRSPTTLSPTVKASGGGDVINCITNGQDISLGPNKIQFVNLAMALPFRLDSFFLQEVYFNKATTNLGIIVIDIVGQANGVWHGKGIEVIPGAVNGMSTIPIKIWKELTPEEGPYTLGAYFVDKSVYDAELESGNYYKDALAEATKVESDPICADCTYKSHCGMTTSTGTLTCKSVLNDAECPRPPPITAFDPNFDPNSATRVTVGSLFFALLLVNL